MVKFEVKEIKCKSSGKTRTSIAEFNEGFSHICVDDHCYILVNGIDGNHEPVYHWHEEAVSVLKKLPDTPYNYQPYKDFYGL